PFLRSKIQRSITMYETAANEQPLQSRWGNKHNT
ncbi:putative polar flagellar hook-length control protein FliK, partial [Vibrio parahaemolyticus V-223/04]